MAHKGRFSPKNPGKYKGDPSNIIYRSGWELSMFIILDKSPDIIQWSSEEYVVPYTSPIDGKLHRYFPDVVLWQREKDGSVSIKMIEIKPHSQSIPPNPAATKNKNSKKYLKEVQTWGINDAKWKAATRWCEKRGMTFHVFTEKNCGFF